MPCVSSRDALSGLELWMLRWSALSEVVFVAREMCTGGLHRLRLQIGRRWLEENAMG
uniref:Uncharacterized protein n=1 Tax=Arundo donax TaxID=35708 RepID=A0A0A8XWU8_ARUDO